MATYAGRKVIGDDHFRPDDSEDPADQRRRRGWLEQIDYTAFVCSKEMAARAVGRTNAAQFQALALACAQARAAWVAEGLKTGGAPDVAKLARMRAAYEELKEVYEAARRMVERGYVAYEPGKAAASAA